MPTIVEYTDARSPRNEYPDRIVSPLQAGPCCFTDMENVGVPAVEGRWRYQYRRCRVCGFTVRVIIQELPDADAIASLRATFRVLLNRQ